MADVSKNKNVLIAVLVIGVLAAGSFGIYRSSVSNTVGAPTNPPVSQQDVPSAVSASYKDGDYTAVGTYTAPNGQETIGVNVTLKNNVITNVAVQAQSTQPQSKRFQDMFAENVQGAVVGKNISEINLKKVSGSSLTPKGFNDALNKIKTQAAQA